MSQENVELSQAWREAWNAGDMDAVREFYDPDVVVRPNEDWPERGPFFGREAVMQWFEQLRDTWDTLVIETISQIDAGDRIVERLISRGMGRGPAYGAEFTTVTTVRKGKILYVEFFWDHAEALEALGLSEEDTTSDELLGVMRRWFDAWNRSDLDAFADLFDADAELITDPSWMEAGPFKGRAAIRNWYEGLKESWSERDAVVLRELFELDDRVVARLDWQVRGRVSGIDTELDATSVNIIERGKIVRQQWFFDYGKALEAIGLSE